MRPAPSDYTDRQLVIFTPATACAGGSTLLNINGLGAKQIYKIDGAMNPSANDCRAGQPMLLLYNASLNGGNGGFVIASSLQNSPASVDVGGTIASRATIGPAASLDARYGHDANQQYHRTGAVRAERLRRMHAIDPRRHVHDGYKRKHRNRIHSSCFKDS